MLLNFVVAMSIFAYAHAYPAETSNIQPASGTTRARLLLDALGTVTNAQKTAQSATRVAGEGVDVLQDSVVENTNEIVGHTHNAIDRDTQALSDALKSVADTSGKFANTATIIFFSFPRVVAKSAGSIVGAEST